METQMGCKPPSPSTDPNTTTTASASPTDGPQWKCVQVGQDNKINEERVDEKGVEGKMRGVPQEMSIYMLKTKLFHLYVLNVQNALVQNVQYVKVIIPKRMIK